MLIKVDVEGNDCDVLLGLGGIERTFADFAALVEIRHLSESELAALMDCYEVELFDEANNALVSVSGTPPDRTFACVYNMACIPTMPFCERGDVPIGLKCQDLRTAEIPATRGAI